MIPLPPIPTLFPYTTLFRSREAAVTAPPRRRPDGVADVTAAQPQLVGQTVPNLDLGDEPVVVDEPTGDRKSTRLNSSHVRISYAVFCLKKKKSHYDILNVH